ncbi:MAG: heme exporter protein CcmB [Fimbriimonadaceae bacterium]
MKSPWTREILAVLEKELKTEQRSRAGFLTSMLSSVLIVISLAYGAFGSKLESQLAAGLFWVALIFAAVAALPRTFLAEEEAGTADLLRLAARPHAIFWGKALFNCLQILVTATILIILFAVMMGLVIKVPLLMVVGLVGGALGLSGTVTFGAALVAQGSNRSMLVGVVCLPLMIPLIMMGISSFRVAFGAGLAPGGWASALGVWLYTAMVFSVAPNLFALVWAGKRS